MPAAVVDAMEVLGCERSTRVGSSMCETHGSGWLSDVDACALAEHVATVVLAAGRTSIPRVAADLTGYEAKASHMAEEARLAHAALARPCATVHQPARRSAALMCTPSGGQYMRKVCTGCGTDNGNWQVWPCPTIRAIEAK
jgi:hypothetical protein